MNTYVSIHLQDDEPFKAVIRRLSPRSGGGRVHCYLDIDAGDANVSIFVPESRVDEITSELSHIMTISVEVD